MGQPSSYDGPTCNTPQQHSVEFGQHVLDRLHILAASVTSARAVYTQYCVGQVQCSAVAHKCQRPENPQHNNLKLLCCGFSGRCHLWATERSAVTVTVTLCLHFTAGCTTGCMNYANEPSQAAIERARQDDYGVIVFTHAATRLCGQQTMQRV